MAGQNTKPDIAALRKLEASLQSHLHDHRSHDHRSAQHSQAAWAHSRDIKICPWRSRLNVNYWREFSAYWWRRLHKLVYVAGSLGAVVMLAVFALWWRLASGPIELDVATPWLTAAIAENFGDQQQVEVGGTVLERDENGHVALRIRDIVVRDADGTVVASAPKAEVGISTLGLLRGRVRAQKLSLVGAELAVRIEPDSKVTVFAGANKRPFVTASAVSTPVMLTRAGPVPTTTGALRASAAIPPTLSAARNSVPDLLALLAWIDGLGVTGLDGRDLGEIGLKSGNLTVDDQRNGKQWSFQDISLSLTRPKAGGIALTLSNDSVETPWLLRATLTPGEHGRRLIDIETQKVPLRDLMLAMRLGDGEYELNLPLSAHIRADVGPDGIPQMVDGHITMDKGFIVDADDPLDKVAIDRAEFSLDWDTAHQALMVPFQIVSGGNRITLLAQADAPRNGQSTWGVTISGGSVVLASTAAADPNPIILSRLMLKLRVDQDKRRIDVEQGDVGNADIGLAISGNLDYSTSDPKLQLGIAGNRMSVMALKRLWPFFVTPKVRSWVEDHISGGTIERMVIATNAPLSTLKSSGPPVPDDGLSIEIVSNGTEVRPVEGLPPIRDADVTVRISGRTAVITLGRGNVELSPGRKLAIANGQFEVPDTFPKSPPAKVRFRLDGPVPAAAELLALPRLRDYSGAPIDPATSRGTLSAQVNLGMPLREDLPPGSTNYSISMDVVNFAAEHMVMGQKIEALALHVGANNQGYQLKGDVKINGVAAALDYRKPRGDGDAEVRFQGTLDDSARARFGFDMGSYISGPMPVRIGGRVPANDGDSRYAVEADLTQVKIDNLFPGWTKPAGKPARATFTLITKGQSSRVEDIAIEAPGTSVKGSLDLDDSGQVVAANFPIFALSEGDKTTLKADRGPDGTLRLVIRGDVFDGRAFVKSAMSGPSAGVAKQKQDFDLDVKLGTVVGHHGETLRSLDLKMARRGGAITSLAMNAKLGRDAALIGDLRGRNGGRQVVYIEAKDAGAFFRFGDIYPKIFGGEMWVAMDPPTPDLTPQEGILNIKDFQVRGEPALDRVASGAPVAAGAQRPGVEFSRMRVEFTRSLGRFVIREGIVRGPLIGATVDGYIDYFKQDVHMRGTFVPLFGLNNMFGQIPLFGIFLGGGSNEGLVGVTYEVVGPPGAPTLRVNPISVAAPGLLRKFFEFPNSTNATSSAPQSYADPNR